MGFRAWAVAVAALAALMLAPAASAERALAIVSPTTLVAFDTAAPGTATVRKIVNLGAGESVIGIDKRPATGEIIIITVPAGAAANALINTYSLNPDTGSATFVGSIPALTVPGAADIPTGLDFQPLVDRMRVTPSNNENFRINPNNGALSGNDPDLTYMAGVVGPIIEVAYDRNVAPGPPGTPAPPGAATTLYAISRTDSKLALIGGLNGTPSPNTGQVGPIGGLGVALSAGEGAGFDISAQTGIAYGALTSAVGPGFYTIDLATGLATLQALLPPVARVDGLTIMNPETTKPTGLLGAIPGATARNLLRRTWKVRFSTSEPVNVASTLTAKVNGRRKTIGKGTASLAAAGLGSIGAPLTNAGKSLVHKMQRTRGTQVKRATFTVVLTDLSGNMTTLKASVTIRA
jgi:hypothetical protein